MTQTEWNNWLEIARRELQRFDETLQYEEKIQNYIEKVLAK